MNLVYGINTYIDGETIVNEISTQYNGISEVLHRTVINTSDAHIKEALIRLGWTPPHRDKAEKEA